MTVDFGKISEVETSGLHGSTHSAGVAILSNNFKGEIVHTKADPKGHWLTMVTKVTGKAIILCNVYGYCIRTSNNALLEDKLKN